jgi:hypothetical protein
MPSCSKLKYKHQGFYKTKKPVKHVWLYSCILLSIISIPGPGHSLRTKIGFIAVGIGQAVEHNVALANMKMKWWNGSPTLGHTDRYKTRFENG